MAEEEHEVAEWVEAIKHHISCSQGSHKQIKAPKTAGFWKNYKQISVETLIKNANTFDFLVYRSNCMSAKAIRGHTNSDFDHVSMIFKLGSKPDEIFILETNGNRGVHVKRWKSVERHLGKHYERICLRQMHFKRKTDQLEQLNKFIEQTEGNSYAFK